MITVFCGVLVAIPIERILAVCTNPPPGLVNWWPAENSGADIAGTYPGTLLNGTGYDVGRVGNAFSFDGTNDIVLLNAPALPPPWTAEFWVYRLAAPEDSAVLLSSSNAALKLEQFPNTKRVGITTWGVQDYSYNYTAPTGTWTHLVFVGNAGSTLLYTNGALHGSLNVGISLPRTTMGRDVTNRFNKALNGRLDEISLYSRALSANEIQLLYNAGADGKCIPCTNNDNFVCRVVIAGSSLTNVISNEDATRELGEPLHGGASCSNSIWYSWTAPSSGGVVIQATTDFEFASPILAVYAGTSLANLSNVAFNFGPFNGQGAPLNKARVVFTAAANQTYHIAVDGAPVDNPDYVAKGDITFALTLTPPPTNDFFSNAIPIAGLFYEITNGTFRGASRETGEPTHGTNFDQTVWWTWIAPTNLSVSSIPVRLSADAVNHPPAMGVYTGNTVSTLIPITTSQAADGMSRTVTFTAAAGQTYHFALAGLQNDVESVLPLIGDFRFRFNTRALGLTINNVVTNSISSTQAVNFTATASITNLGSAASGPLRVLLTAVPGISMRGPNVLFIDEQSQTLTNYSTAGLSSGHFTNFPIAGAAPPPAAFPPGTRAAEGFGVHAELQESAGTNWITVDETLVVYGNWPELAGLPGPGGGVIRLDPGFIGTSAFNPLVAVTVIGSPAAIEGRLASYFGQARYANNFLFNFTNTTWLATLFNITNGVYSPGIVNSNTPVTLTAQFSSSGFIHSAVSNVTVINLPSPLLTQLNLVGSNFTLRIEGVSNRIHVVEATTNLTPPQVWLPVGTNTLGANGLWNFTNGVGATPQQFYRAREVE